MAKKIIDIGALSKEQQDAIKEQIDTAKGKGKEVEAKRAKEALDFYYQVKDEIEAELIKKLAQQPTKDKDGKDITDAKGKNITQVSRLAEKAQGDNGWSLNKILKQISTLPNKRASNDDGYIKAARNIEKGKPPKISAETRKKREAAAKEKEKAKTQEGARDKLFNKEVSDRKKVATAKKAAAKKAPAKKAAVKK